MENITIKNLSFKYPESGKKALDDISLEISQGEYIVLAGKSGCGKSTLLRHLKPSLTPNGEREGGIFIGEKEIGLLSEREQAEKIGFVMQDPDNQIVTDKVWHELAFGLENLGLDSDTIRLRVSETAEYFGISEWFTSDTASLSGGQKQLLNLASVTAMRPDILILDEPVSQLDPSSAGNFLGILSKLNKETGITVIITEHRLEEIFNSADKIAVMDNGKIISFASPSETGELLPSVDIIKYLLPAPMRIYAETGDFSLPCPVSVRDGVKWLSETVKSPVFTSVEADTNVNAEISLKLKEVYFKYEKKGKEIIKYLNASFKKGVITAVLGASGAGKSTLLKLIAGIYKPLSGKVSAGGKLKTAYMPQQTRNVFTEKTVLADLEIIDKNKENIGKTVEVTGIRDILNSNPFDISGGEAQRAALAKLLLTSPDVLLLDEPTKGMDGEFKEKFALILRNLADGGKTVIIVSHDVEFCASYTDECMFLFDGAIASHKDTRSFFCANAFYTTAASRMSRPIFENAVTAREVIYLCGKNLKIQAKNQPKE